MSEPFVKITTWEFKDYYASGPSLIVSETPDRRFVRISIRSLDGREVGVYLRRTAWQALCDLRYEWQGPHVEPEDEPEPAETEA